MYGFDTKPVIVVWFSALQCMILFLDSMASDHLACRTDVWESLTERQQEILTTAEKVLAMDLILTVLVENGEALTELPAEGITIYDWSAEDRAQFRGAAQSTWDKWAARTPEAKEIVDSHKAFIKKIGLTQ